MAKKVHKYIIQCDNGYGFETLYTSDNYAEALEVLRMYAPQYGSFEIKLTEKRCKK